MAASRDIASERGRADRSRVFASSEGGRCGRSRTYANSHMELHSCVYVFFGLGVTPPRKGPGRGPDRPESNMNQLVPGTIQGSCRFPQAGVVPRSALGIGALPARAEHTPSCTRNIMNTWRASAAGGIPANGAGPGPARLEAKMRQIIPSKVSGPCRSALRHRQVAFRGWV